ncbi:retrovirus-related pol polyprotein from transposon TNT 1-94 [Tanacetum coccineum]
MTTLADKSLLSGGDNKPPMLEKHLYDSWKSRMELYMMNRPHGRMILASVEKGPLVWPSITEDGVTRLKEYVELTPAEAIQADCDIKAINIILQGLPTEIYALVSQHRVAKDLWEKIKLLMQGTSLTKQERECKLYDEFDKFTYKKGETLHEYYLRFTLLLNDMNIYKMPLEQFQVNTKFLNTLPDEWSKFVTDVKLVKDLHTTNVDQLHAHLQQHERHAIEVRLMHERNPDPLALVASDQLTQQAYQSYLTNMTVQPVQGRQTTYAAGTTRKYTPGASGSNTGKQRTVICYNCKGEGHIAKQCTKPKRKRDETWFNDKVLLVQAQAGGQALTEEEIAFLADPGLPDVQTTTIYYGKVDCATGQGETNYLCAGTTRKFHTGAKCQDALMQSLQGMVSALTEHWIKDIVKTVVNLSVNASDETVTECQKCLELETELVKKKDFVDKETYDKLCKCFTTFENIASLGSCSPLNQESFNRKRGFKSQCSELYSVVRIK